MNYKLLTGTLLASSLILTACGSSEENKDEKSEVKKEKSTTEKATTEKPTTEKPTTEKPTTEDPTTEIPTTELPTTEMPSTEAPVTFNVNNVTSRQQLESIIYNNSISEMDKATAYNSAVDNGVIPQGNVMEGPAIAAYESSLRVESGAEKSVYESNPDPGNPNTEKYNDLFENEPSSNEQESYPYPTGEYDTNSPTYEEDENGNWVEVTE
ncbi:hypothetical protein [Macrococcoides canis]|uniref:hypothetical protein n=1 Tax=Macrococcoides canis TaxID=1855823 RepID=UPI001AA06294|nr:hypothetical protein [Macrococcus canis]